MARQPRRRRPWLGLARFAFAANGTGRFDKAIAIGVVACVVLMSTCFCLAQMYWFRAAMAGSAFVYARESYEPMQARSVEEKAQHSLRTSRDLSRQLATCGSWLGILAIAGTILAGLRSYREWRHWHWLTFAAAGPCMVAAWFAVGRLLFGTGSSGTWIPVSCGVVLACIVDLRRAHSTGAGRIVAWCVLAVGVLAGLAFAASAPVGGLE